MKYKIGDLVLVKLPIGEITVEYTGEVLHVDSNVHIKILSGHSKGDVIEVPEYFIELYDAEIQSMKEAIKTARELISEFVSLEEQRIENLRGMKKFLEKFR